MPDIENSAPLAEEIEIKEEELSDDALASVSGGAVPGTFNSLIKVA